MRFEYYSLHNHSDFSNGLRSFADSSMKLEPMISYAKEIGVKGIAITDHEGISSHIRAKKFEKSLDMDVILGNEIYLVSEQQDRIMRESYDSSIHYYPHFLLLGLNEKGHEQIRELSTIAWRDSYRARGMIRTTTLMSDVERVIGQNKGNVIGSTACLGSYLSRSIVKWKLDGENRKGMIDDFINWGKRVFGEGNFFLEAQPAKINNVEQWVVNDAILELSKEHDVPYIITTDGHYLKKDYFNIHRSFLNGDSDEDEREAEKFYATTYIMSAEEIYDYFTDFWTDEEIQYGFDSSMEIGSRAERFVFKKKPHVPRIKFDEGWEYVLNKNFFPNTEYISKTLESGHDDDRYLMYLIQNGVKELIPECDFAETFKKIEDELREVWLTSEVLGDRMHSYFITVAKIVDIMWNQGDSLVGTGRGSVVVCLIAYLTGITQINPLKMTMALPFYRFMTSERADFLDIDIDSQQDRRGHILRALREYFRAIGGDVLNCSTWSTLTARSAIQTTGRGFELDTDTIQALSNSIPLDNGMPKNLKDSYYGNIEKEWEPDANFVKIVDQYENDDGLKLIDVALLVEGLIINRGTHAGGVFCLNREIFHDNALMISPSGTPCTQWELHDSEEYGLIKLDALTTKGMGKIRKTLDLLVEDGLVEQKKTLKETYMSILDPMKLNYDTPKTWELLKNNEVMDLFQFNTPVAKGVLKQIQPANFTELCQSNSLMRLRKQDGAKESPTETFVKYKNNIQLAYDEMDEWKVPKEDQNILESMLLKYSFVADTQEIIMELVKNEKLLNLSIRDTHRVRKSIAKKSKKAQEEIKKELYIRGEEIGLSKNTVDYIWKVQIHRQLNYSFASPHIVAYSYIALQELVLYRDFPTQYWDTACLTVNSGAEDEDEENVGKTKTTNYGKISEAIGVMKQNGKHVSPPDINFARFSFAPDVKNDRIVFGLKGVSGVGDNEAHQIINNRPYKSFNDFVSRVVDEKQEITLTTGKTQQKSLVSTSATISLIKGGAFDELDDKSREEIMLNFINHLYPPKKSMNIRGIDQVIPLGIIPEEHQMAVKIYNFRKFITDSSRFVRISETAKSKKWYRLIGNSDEATDYIMNFFEENFLSELVEDKDYEYDEDGYVLVLVGGNAGFTKQYQAKTEGIKQWLNSSDCLDRYNKAKFTEHWKKHADGNISKWEMDSISFYYHDHELEHVDRKKYSIQNFENSKDAKTYTDKERALMPFTMYKKTKYPKYPLFRIAGTVLDKNKDKHTISLLTPDGVVLVKYYAGAFGHYDKQLSIVHDDGSPKTVVEGSWFKRGNLLFLTGVRMGDVFKPKVYRGDAFQHSTCLIEEIRDDGTLQLKTERTKI